MAKQIELLEHHAHVGSDLTQLFVAAAKLHSINYYAARIMLFELVYTAYKR